MKRRAIDMASNQFPGYWILPHLEHTEIHRVGQRREGEGGDRGDLVEKKESPKEERAVKPVISLSSKNGY